MKIDYKRIISSRGASMVIALVVFLIAALFSMTIVTGALTGLQNVNRQQDEEQLYLAASSAADVVEHCVSEGAIWTLEITKADEYSTPVELKNLSTEEKTKLTTQIRTTYPDLFGGEKKYSKLLEDNVTAIVANTSSDEAVKEIMGSVADIINTPTGTGDASPITISPTDTEYSNLSCALKLSYDNDNGITAKIQPSTTTASGSSLYSNNITVVFEENTMTVFANTVSVEDAEYTITVTEHTFKNYTVKKG